MARPPATRAIASRNAEPGRETHLLLLHREKFGLPADRLPRAEDDLARALPALEKLSPCSTASVSVRADDPGNCAAPSIRFGRPRGIAISPTPTRARPGANPPPRLRARNKAANPP